MTEPKITITPEAIPTTVRAGANPIIIPILTPAYMFDIIPLIAPPILPIMLAVPNANIDITMAPKKMKIPAIRPRMKGATGFPSTSSFIKLHLCGVDLEIQWASVSHNGSTLTSQT